MGRSRLAEKVLAAASELDYRPNLAARHLRVARSSTLGVVFSRLDGQSVSDLLHGLDSEARNRGYSLILADAGGDPARFAVLLGQLEKQQVDGLILYRPPASIEAEVNHLRVVGIPVFAVYQRPPNLDIPLVTYRPTRSIGAAVDRLAELGHRSIGYLGSDSDIGDFRTRLLTEATAEHGMTFSVLRVEEYEVGDFTAVSTALSRFRDETAVTALLTQHHNIPSVLGAVHEVGQRIPEDLSLISFGDGPWLLANRPQISAFSSRAAINIGLATVQRLVEVIDGTTPVDHTYEATEAIWIERDSVGPAPARGLLRGFGRILNR